MSEVEQYDSSLLRIETEHGPRWLTVHDKFAPYGYVPAEMRGQPAIRLVAGTPTETVTSTGGLDGLTLEGRADLKEDGSATMEFVQSFSGKVGIAMRNVFDKIAETQVKDFVESRLLGRNFPGARLRDMQIENKKDLLAPLVVRVHADVPQLARPEGKRLVLRALFPVHMAKQLASLPSRQTPMLLTSSSHTEVRFTIVAPESVRMPTSLPAGEARDGERFVVVKDAVHGHALSMERTVDVPAGRVQPGEEYARFADFTQKADALLESDVVLGRP
jgi:hypothetical protein